VRGHHHSIKSTLIIFAKLKISYLVTMIATIVLPKFYSI